MKSFTYAIADSPEGAVEALAQGWKAKGSGVDLLDLLKERIEPANRLVTLDRIASMKTITKRGDSLIIGGGVTLRQIASSPEVQEYCPALADAAGHAATPQIRTVATAAGNLMQRPRCWYFRAQEFHCLKKGGPMCFAVEGENRYHAIFGPGPCHIIHPSNLAGPLVAARANVLLCKKGVDRSVPAPDFFQLPNRNLMAENVAEPDELLLEIELPRRATKSGYAEYREKQSYDWPLASASAVLDADGWHVVMGHVAPIPWRAKKAEEILGTTQSITVELADKAAEAALDGAEPMSGNAWRLELARAAVRDALLLADGKEIG